MFLFPFPSFLSGGHLFQRCWMSKGNEDCSVPWQYTHLLYYLFSSYHYIWLRANSTRKSSVHARADLSKQAWSEPIAQAFLCQLCSWSQFFTVSFRVLSKTLSTRIWIHIGKPHMPCTNLTCGPGGQRTCYKDFCKVCNLSYEIKLPVC